MSTVRDRGEERKLIDAGKDDMADLDSTLQDQHSMRADDLDACLASSRSPEPLTGVL